MIDNQPYGTGRRKTSTARVYLRPGTGEIRVNARSFDDYFRSDVQKMVIRQPLVMTETADNVDITIRVTDSGGESYQETFTIHINDLNEAPTDLALSGGSVPENSPAGSVVGVASASAPDRGESFTYELVDDAGGRFTIDGTSGEVPAINYLNGRIMSIAGGSNQIQRNIISERILGLPREPSDDRDKPFREVLNDAKNWGAAE